MNNYLIESLAPLVFRSGKPFGSQASAQDVIFPLPSAAAGLVRALAIGQDKLSVKQPLKFGSEQYNTILKTATKGPFLVRYRDGEPKNLDNTIELLVPKPANAIYLEHEGDIKLFRLVPKAFDESICGSDLPNGLLPVQLETDIKGKPQKGTVYWRLQDVLKWQSGETLNYDEVNRHGIDQLPIDIRIHVAIDDDTLGSVEGQLFQTASFDLAHQRNFDNTWCRERFAFLVQSEENLKLDNDLATFGGERRLSHFKQANIIPIQSEDTLQARLTAIQDSGGFSLTFLTPTIFEQGYLPEWINEDDEGNLTGVLPETNVNVRLRSAAIDRWQGVSGWDSILWKPKATRRAVCAGSVYWFELLEANKLTAELLQQLEQWQWADNPQDRHDGFGSVLMCAWRAI